MALKNIPSSEAEMQNIYAASLLLKLHHQYLWLNWCPPEIEAEHMPPDDYQRVKEMSFIATRDLIAL